MASRKENIKALFSNTRSRVVIIFTLVLVLLAIVIGYFKFGSKTDVGSLGSASVASGPGAIQSIPGALDQTAQYAKLQEEQNVTQATKAVTTGGSAIPTIIRTKALGEGVGVVTAKGTTGVGFSTLQRENEGGAQKSIWIQALKDGSCSKSAVEKVVSQGAQINELKEGCTCVQLKDNGYVLRDLKQVCECKELKAAGYNARDLKDIGFSAQKLLACGFSACELRTAGFSAAEMKAGGFADGELKGAGFSDSEINRAGGVPAGMTADMIRKAGCSVEALTKLRKSGVSAAAIRRISGCSAAQLRAAGYSAKDLRDAGFTAAELRNAGFSEDELRDAGFSAKEIADTKARKGDCSIESLRKARAAGVSALTIRQTLGCSAEAMRKAGYTAKELRDAGFTAAELRDAGFTAADLKNVGFLSKDLKDVGFSPGELKSVGFLEEDTKVVGLPAVNPPAPKPAALPSIPSVAAPKVTEEATNAMQLQAILDRQNQQMAEQKYQQKIQQRTSEMMSAANQSLQEWKRAPTQAYTEGNQDNKKGSASRSGANEANPKAPRQENMEVGGNAEQSKAVIKTGDILFAVLDTSVNSDEPGPILATIVSGKLKGSKLIGSFNLPSNANKMIITFNTLSVPGIDKTIGVNAVAIDPNTARTALSSNTNHHYMMRYGSLFAATFLQGFGNAILTTNTTITIGGTGGGNNINVATTAGQSTLQQAVIGLATVGKAWAQQAQQVVNTPTTVQVYSGTGMGVLFTQDVAIS
jgi:intracellular multiplication protein IcmE